MSGLKLRPGRGVKQLAAVTLRQAEEVEQPARDRSEIGIWIDDAGHPLSEAIWWLDRVIRDQDNGLWNQPPVRMSEQNANQQR